MHRHRAATVSLALAASLLLPSCALLPGYTAPGTEPVEAWGSAVSERGADGRTGARPGLVGSVDEQTEFFFAAGEAPEHPQRVIALWRVGSELAELGVVGVGQLDGEYAETQLPPEIWRTVAEVPVVGGLDGIDIEKVIRADPDLIIGMDNGGLGFDYTELAQLYPVRILPAAEPTTVWHNYEKVASLVGRSSDFEAQRNTLDERLAEIESEHGDVLGGIETTVVGARGGDVQIDTSKSLAYERLSAAGFGYNSDYIENPKRYVFEMTLENLPQLADQDILFYDVEVDGTIVPDVQALLDEPAFRELPAVRAGHLYPLRGATVYTFDAANLMAEDLADAAERYVNSR